MDTRTSEARLRLDRIRDVLAARGVDAVVVPSSDPHLSEYLPERWQGRQWASGFTGSVGTLAVTRDHAALFADSRYWEQAERQLAGSSIELVRIATAASPEHLDWLVAHVAPGGTVAVDGEVLGLGAARQLRQRLESEGRTLVTDLDVFADAWSERPAMPAGAIYEHAGPEATETRASKLARLRQAMVDAGATHHLVSSVDDIAWILNLRGADVGYNPVFLAHLLLEADAATLFVPAGKIDAALERALAADAVRLAPYENAGAAVERLPGTAALLVDPKRTTLGFVARAEAGGRRIVERINPSTLAKSRKSDAEAAHVRQAMVEDGVAMAEFYAWFERALERGEALTELTVDEKLLEARARRPGHMGPSFATIAAFNANGAMPHYRATPESHARIEGDGLLLIDSGGQYRGGTTDITRMWPIGRLGEAQKRDVTRVLKGTIALSRACFPRGTLSPMLDTIARAPLWAEGMDYGHGTGHGVGYFLAVHEGPQSFSRTIPDATMAMEPGMITSIEPGVYRPGRWGVRVENLVLSVPAPELGDEFGAFLRFETLTLCPIDTRCLVPELLDASERTWLDAYHLHRARTARAAPGRRRPRLARGPHRADRLREPTGSRRLRAPACAFLRRSAGDAPGIPGPSPGEPQAHPDPAERASGSASRMAARRRRSPAAAFRLPRPAPPPSDARLRERPVAARPGRLRDRCRPRLARHRTSGSRPSANGRCPPPSAGGDGDGHGLRPLVARPFLRSRRGTGWRRLRHPARRRPARARLRRRGRGDGPMPVPAPLGRRQRPRRRHAAGGVCPRHVRDAGPRPRRPGGRGLGTGARGRGAGRPARRRDRRGQAVPPQDRAPDRHCRGDGRHPHHRRRSLRRRCRHAAPPVGRGHPAARPRQPSPPCSTCRSAMAARWAAPRATGRGPPRHRRRPRSTA
jgi:Xaa-Pro aminopeptidase